MMASHTPCWGCLYRVVMATVIIELTCIVTTAPIGCTFRSSVSATLPETQTVAPEAECQRGGLLWNNPRGSLTATFTQDGTEPVFSLCVTAAGGNETLSGMYDVSTGDAVRIDITFDDTPTCVDSVDGSVVLRFDATDNLDTLTFVEYFKVQPP